MQRAEVYGEGQELSSLDWTELLFRLEDLFKEHVESVTEGGDVLRTTDRRIAATAQEIADGRNDIKPPGGGDDRSPGERCAGDRSPDEDGVGIGNTSGGGGGGERSEPTNQQVPLDIPRVYNEVGKRFTSFTADEKTTGEESKTNSTNSQTHTPEESARRIAKLVREGMAEHLAREELIG